MKMLGFTFEIVCCGNLGKPQRRRLGAAAADSCADVGNLQRVNNIRCIVHAGVVALSLQLFNHPRTHAGMHIHLHTVCTPHTHSHTCVTGNEVARLSAHDSFLLQARHKRQTFLYI